VSILDDLSSGVWLICSKGGDDDESHELKDSYGLLETERRDPQLWASTNTNACVRLSIHPQETLMKLILARRDSFTEVDLVP